MFDPGASDCVAIPPASAETGSRTALACLCRDVAAALPGADDERDCRVAQALLPYLSVQNLLDEAARQGSAERYRRNLLHAGPDHTIVSLVWQPGQMSPVHAHRTWCAFGVYSGWLVETFFAFGPGQRAVAKGCRQRRHGSINHAMASGMAAHRLANLGMETAVSIHVYGAPHDRLGEAVNQIWGA